VGAFCRAPAAVVEQASDDAGHYRSCSSHFANSTQLEFLTSRQISAVSVTDEIFLSAVATGS